MKAAKALDVRKHPNADKLSLVDVDFGSGTTTVVCGAPNVVAGMVVPYAPSGATLPGGFTLERRKIRGVVSDGMLCSPQELGLGDDHSGILGLDADTELGADIRDVLGLNEIVFDLAITPNRPDAMSIVGVARDLAAHFGLPFAVPDPVVDGVGCADRLGHHRRHRSVGPLPAVHRAAHRGDDGGVAGVDGAPPDARGHAADLERRRRHELRDARARPAAARVRPRPAARAGHRGAAGRATARR